MADPDKEVSLDDLQSDAPQNEFPTRKNLRQKQKPKPPKSGFSILRFFKWLIFGTILMGIVLAAGIGIGFVTATMNTRPNIEDIVPPASSQIYDANGNEIANIHATENRRPVKIEQIPMSLQNAFVATEDNRFYEHKGIDPQGILRAIYNNIRSDGIAEGGSTITQQLAKNAYLTQEQTYRRKIQEAFLAIQLERQYTKQEILEMYLNQIYFGQGAYGVEAAARTYFNKDVEQLDLAECALIAGIPKSPNYYSPFNNLEASRSRRNTVLEQMYKYGYITITDRDAAIMEEIVLAPQQEISSDNSPHYFIDYVIQDLIDRYGADKVYKEGLKIYTTIDMDLQRQAESAMQLLPNYYTDANGIAQPQGALVAIDPTNGYIKAMVGGRGNDQFNRATMATRQPGSAFKPFVFAAALENDFTPDTTIDDSPVTIGSWSPQNDSRRFSGRVTLRTVATFSMNVPTVKIAQKLGMDKPIYYAQEMGISTFVLEGDPNDRNFATSLGGMTRGVTPLEITSAYGTFANHGLHVNPVSIIRILDRNGQVIEENEAVSRLVISEASAAMLNSMLSDVIIRGTGRSANIGRPAAGKTGTTSDYKDAWFVGYTPDLVAGVWVGNDDNSSTDGIMGGGVPADIWRTFMTQALADVPVHYFDDPAAFGVSGIAAMDGGESDSKSSSESENRSNRNESSEPPVERNDEPIYDAPTRDAPRERFSEVESEPERETPRRSYEPEPEPVREVEPIREPEPIYEPESTSEPEPEYEAPSRSYDSPPRDDFQEYYDVPTQGGGISKGRN